MFRRLCRDADLLPIDLRDLRHVAATLVHAGGDDIHAVKEALRHTTIQLTSETWTSHLPQLDGEIAEKAAAPAPRARREAAVGTPAHASLTQEIPGE